MNIGVNFNLLNLDALSNLIEVNEMIKTSVAPPCNGCHPNERGNDILADFCGFENLFTNRIYQDVEFTDNAHDPTEQDIIDGYCSI